MDLKSVIIMLVGLAILLFGKKQQGSKLGTPLTVLGAIIAVAGAAMGIFNFSKSGSKFYNNEKSFRYAQGNILAEAAKKSCSPSKVCVIANPSNYLDVWGDPLDVVSDVYVEAVKDVLDKCEVVVLYPEYKNKKPSDPKQAAALAKKMIPYPVMLGKDYRKLVDKIKKEKPDCIINTFMFPPESSLATSLEALKGFKIGFLNTDFYGKSATELQTAFKGKQGADIFGVVLQKKAFDVDKTPAGTVQKTFDIRYVLATQENNTQALQESNK